MAKPSEIVLHIKDYLWEERLDANLKKVLIKDHGLFHDRLGRVPKVYY